MAFEDLKAKLGASQQQQSVQPPFPDLTPHDPTCQCGDCPMPPVVPQKPITLPPIALQQPAPTMFPQRPEQAAIMGVRG